MAAAMTKDWIQNQCKKYQQYRTPTLNDRLYLQNQGFSIIENLEEYTEVKTVYLECNCIESLSGLQLMTKLRNLVLHKNNIGAIEHLDNLKMLDSLDLSDNMLTKLENLACCPILTSLNVSNNHLKTSESIDHLKKCINLKVLDLSKNNLEDGEHLLEVLKSLPSLSCLYLSGNPCLREIPNYRKTVISSLPGLKHLDHTPVFWSERIYADAWAKDGDKGIEAARDVVHNNIRENERLQFEGMRRLREQAVQERMTSIETPLLQFDDEELNPKPLI
ncbi:hypothetical protein M758_2G239500 [Ceratodon purpureus]|nr:hypothetical protein M758_2G239500 [Ceratodon purpureus]